MLEPTNSDGASIPGYDRVLNFVFAVLSMGNEKAKVHGGVVAPESSLMVRTAAPFVPEVERITLNLHWAFQVVLPLLKEGDLDIFSAELIVDSARDYFEKEKILVDLDFTGESSEVQTIVVGDIHGQFKDLVKIFETYGPPSENLRYIFNGDIVDRGPRSVACWLLLCALKVAVPRYLYVTRGNHETRTIRTESSSFASECFKKYNLGFYTLCQSAFDELPVSYTLNRSIFVILKPFSLLFIFFLDCSWRAT